MKQITILGTVSFLALSVYGWGTHGHQTVGYLAMQFLLPNALNFVQTSLGPTYSQSLGPASTWADSVKFTTGWTWSQPLHYVDALDNPPATCSVDQNRDCADGKCILSAIANYTTRVADTTLSDAERQTALKFLGKYKFIDFFGDVTQPLHCEAVQAGGNGIPVTCSGSSTNLHHIWDTNMVDKYLTASFGGSVTTWANYLAAQIRSGVYTTAAHSWISCSSPYTPLRRSIADDIESLSKRTITPLLCPLVWAQDSNSYDCSYVFSYTPGTDLCTTSYYTGAAPIIETQIAKGGYRLAAWLNVLFDGTTGLP